MNTSNKVMYYSLRHLTRFRYTAPITESVMEVRMQPRSEQNQRCLEFHLTTDPPSNTSSYRDVYGNIVHHFNIPGRHAQLTITTEALVQLDAMLLPPYELPADSWDKLDEMVATDEYWDWLEPSQFARPSDMLHEFAQEINIHRGNDPLSTLRAINTTLYKNFAYVPHSTTVDSPIEDALRLRRGVCQDFAHIMITLVRMLGIPCRYVSGYLFHRTEDQDRSEEDATHAWVEVLLPELGWVGFDPTNDLIATERHIRTAIGRDYADVPPTLGVFKGEADTELDVGVRVAPTEAPIPEDEELLPVVDWAPPMSGQEDDDQQQQQ